MGYQNGNRPRNLDNKLLDARFDLSDLLGDIYDGVPHTELYKSVEFIRETLQQYDMGIRRRNKRKKK